MTELMHIREYAFATAKTIASVINEEVVICDNEMNLLGDSNCSSPSELTDISVTKQSIMLNAMAHKTTIVSEDIKHSLKGCSLCANFRTCDIHSIIAFPLLKNDVVIGCIALYSKEKRLSGDKKERVDQLKNFISKMSELLISKLDENQENYELSVVKKQLQAVVDHIGSAVVCIENVERIIYGNQMFRKLFGIGPKMPERITDIRQLAECSELMKSLYHVNGTFSKELSFSDGKTEINHEMVTVVSINDEGTQVGSVIYFRDSEKYYEELNRVTNASSEMTFKDLIGKSKPIQNLKMQAQKIANSLSTVLIQGESGTGKEIIARAIHNASRRSAGPFISVNCAAIPDNLLESELFGYEEGAFTGAAKGGRIGKFQLANKGTLLLDEVGEIPIHLQAKLLRAIQEKKIQRIGSNVDIATDIRIIAATNRNLEEMIVSGAFREDLFYRLNVIPIYVPALRERKSDIPFLVDTFIKKYNEVLNKNISRFSKKAMKMLETYDWPGNVRELQNVVEYCVNISNRRVIEPDSLPARVKCERKDFSIEHSAEIKPLKDVEKAYIDEAIRVYGDTTEGKQKAADALGIGIATLYRKLKE